MKRLVPALFIAFVMSLSLTGSIQAQKPEFAKKNQPSYWGENCYKLEIDGDVKTYTATDHEATKVIIKGGAHHKTYEEGPFTDLTAAFNERSGKTYGISHVIICIDGQSDGENGNIGGDTDKDEEKDKEQPAVKEPEVLGEAKGDKPETLPATGAPILVNALTGGLISISTGYLHLMSRRRGQQAQRIEKIAL